jgi:hypothetical protein
MSGLYLFAQRQGRKLCPPLVAQTPLPHLAVVREMNLVCAIPHCLRDGSSVPSSFPIDRAPVGSSGPKLATTFRFLSLAPLSSEAHSAF